MCANRQVHLQASYDLDSCTRPKHSVQKRRNYLGANGGTQLCFNHLAQTRHQYKTHASNSPCKCACTASCAHQCKYLDLQLTHQAYTCTVAVRKQVYKLGLTASLVVRLIGLFAGLCQPKNSPLCPRWNGRVCFAAKKGNQRRSD